ncbi:transmembrane protein 198-like isoform X2 [Actinia tenebrosa]|uniref:Transmembrane protein 198 n=1 Tax=Actinia tenebrosa TaxID=6105 RepID=A0A6P8HEP4_ACTTE|nr:transmembrane protein 198-like isoform X2 [Actinia tenebrosa]
MMVTRPVLQDFNLLDYSHHPIGIIMIIVMGLAVWILGFRLIKVIVIAAAFILSGWSFFVLSPHFLHLDVCCAEGTPVQVRIAVSIIVSLMAGAIACFVYKLGLFCLGSCLGLVLAVAGSALVLTNILHSPLAYYGIYGGCALLIGIMAVVFEKIFVILATSVVGSLAVIYEIDYFAKTPFTQTMMYALDQVKCGLHNAVNNPSEFHLHWRGTLTDKTIAMYLGWLLMILVGFYIQFVYTSQEISSKLMVKTCGGNQADYCDEHDEPLTPQYVLLNTAPIRTQVHEYGKAQRIRKYLR